MAVKTTTKAVAKTTGRPPAKLNTKKIRDLAAEFCSIDEIAASQGVVGRTLLRRKDEAEVLDAIETGKALGRSRLRSYLWRMAKCGNVAAAIFLAKQPSILGYSDKTEMQHVGAGSGVAIQTEMTIRFIRPGDLTPAPPAIDIPAAPADPAA